MAQSVAPSLKSRSRDSDPLSKVLALGEREVRLGTVLGLLTALLIHGAGAAQAAANLFDVENFADAVAGYVRNNLQLQIEIDSTPPPPPPPPPEPPPPEPEPEKAPPPPPAANEPPPPPPAPAEAAKVLTAEADPDAPVDLTDQGIVSGEGELHGGITSSTGTAKTVVRDLKAQPGGVPGGTGTAPAPAVKAPEQDLSRRPSPVGQNWNCGFPSEADLDGVDQAIVEITVMVGGDGRAKKVTVLKDPGSGFGNQARQCAMRMAYNPGLDKAGQPAAISATFRIRFTR
jgi:outer membrane biosynthesis protein TonB